MSDADRLRKAADECDATADARGKRWLSEYDRKVAALLQTLDVRQGDIRMILNPWTGLAVRCCEVGRECDVHAAAFDLADTILGDTDE